MCAHIVCVESTSCDYMLVLVRTSSSFSPRRLSAANTRGRTSSANNCILNWPQQLPWICCELFFGSPLIPYQNIFGPASHMWSWPKHLGWNAISRCGWRSVMECFGENDVVHCAQSFAWDDFSYRFGVKHKLAVLSSTAHSAWNACFPWPSPSCWGFFFLSGKYYLLKKNHMKCPLSLEGPESNTEWVVGMRFYFSIFILHVESAVDRNSRKLRPMRSKVPKRSPRACHCRVGAAFGWYRSQAVNI